MRLRCLCFYDRGEVSRGHPAEPGRLGGLIYDAWLAKAERPSATRWSVYATSRAAEASDAGTVRWGLKTLGSVRYCARPPVRLVREVRLLPRTIKLPAQNSVPASLGGAGVPIVDNGVQPQE